MTVVNAGLMPTYPTSAEVHAIVTDEVEPIQLQTIETRALTQSLTITLTEVQTEVEHADTDAGTALAAAQTAQAAAVEALARAAAAEAKASNAEQRITNWARDILGWANSNDDDPTTVPDPNYVPGEPPSGGGGAFIDGGVPGVDDHTYYGHGAPVEGADYGDATSYLDLDSGTVYNWTPPE